MDIPRYQRSVAAARPGRGPRLRPSAGIAVGFGAAAEGLKTVADVLASLEEAEAVHFTTSATATAERDMSVRISEMQAQAAEGAVGFAGAVDKEFKQYKSLVLSRAPNDAAHEMAEARLDRLGGSLFERALEFEVSATRRQRLTSFDQSLDALATAAFNDPGAVARLQAQATGNLAAAEATWMLPEDVSARRALMTPKISEAAIKGLIASEPSAAVHALRSGVFDGELTGVRKAEFLRQAREAVRGVQQDMEDAKKDAEKAEKKAREQAQARTQNEFLARIMGPEVKDGPPSVSRQEILGSNLEPTGGGSKEHFLKLLERKRQGADLNETDPRLYRDRREKIIGGMITDPNQLTGDIGQGLGIDDFERLRRDLEAASTNQGKAKLALRKRALDLAQRELVNSKPLLGINDPEGERRLYTFEFDLDKKLAEGEQAGKTYQQMLDPRSPDYVLGPLIQTYRRTPAEVLADQVRALSDMAPGGGARTITPKGVDPELLKFMTPEERSLFPAEGLTDGSLAPQRLPGETVQQWRARTGR